jgi:NAD(P)-dependent dehydrogenase (short-subunit alcohol dehydrogenase family)
MKSILITGTSTGIGLATARALKERYRVFATARALEDVQKLKDEGFESFRLDLRDRDSIDLALSEILNLTDGKIDILFNNGAYGQAGAVEDLSLEALREQFETNLFGTHYLTTKVIKVMREAGGGKIIQHSSVLGLTSLKFRGAYNSSKYALEGLSDTLRLELKGSNIHISTLNTGPIESSFRSNSLKMFQKHIDVENSYFKDIYKDEVKRRLESSESDSSFTKTPEAVIEKIEHILKSDKPKPRYYITTATYLLGNFKRILSTKLLDRLLGRI